MKNIDLFIKTAKESFFKKHKNAVVGGAVGTLLGPLGTVGGALIGNHFDKKNKISKKKAK